MSARSIAWGRRCRGSKLAMAGPSGTPRWRARCSRSMRCKARCGRGWRFEVVPPRFAGEELKSVDYLESDPVPPEIGAHLIGAAEDLRVPPCAAGGFDVRR